MVEALAKVEACSARAVVQEPGPRWCYARWVVATAEQDEIRELLLGFGFVVEEGGSFPVMMAGLT